MITTRQHEKLIDRIKGLSELELDDLLKDIGQHLRKNKMEHLIDNAFDMDDHTEQIEELEEDVRELETEKDGLTDKLHEIFMICESVEDTEEFEEEAFNELKVAINQIKNKT